MPRFSGPKTPKAPTGLVKSIKGHCSKVEANQLQETIIANVQDVEQNSETAHKCFIAVKNNYCICAAHAERILASLTQIRAISQKLMITVVL